MSDELDRSSTDAMHWAKAFIATMHKEMWNPNDIDEGLMVGWFSNYWAAVHDPLHKQIKELEDRIKNVTFNYQGIEKVQRERIDKLKSRIDDSCKIVEGLFGGGAADEFRKAMK